MSGTEPPTLDLATQAGARSAARLAVLRSPGPAGAAGAAAPPLPASSPVDAVPEAVWEDAQRQLAGMLEGLETLQRAVPALGQPADAVSGARPASTAEPRMSPISAAGGGLGHAEQEDAEQEDTQQDESGRP